MVRFIFLNDVSNLWSFSEHQKFRGEVEAIFETSVRGLLSLLGCPLLLSRPLFLTEFRGFHEGTKFCTIWRFKLLSSSKDSYKITLEQDVRGRRISKNFTIKKYIKPENFIKEILSITSSYNKNKIKILEQKVIKNNIYRHFDNEYKGVKVEASVLINKKIYKLTYILSKKIPILNLVMFSIEQHVKGRREYDLKNYIILKEYSYKGRFKKLW